MKYRKRPVVIEAEQFYPDEKPWPDGVQVFGAGQGETADLVIYKVETIEGWLTVKPGDWIVTGINGEKYPCKPDIFAKTYEMVEAKSERWPNE